MRTMTRERWIGLPEWQKTYWETVMPWKLGDVAEFTHVGPIPLRATLYLKDKRGYPYMSRENVREVATKIVGWRGKRKDA